MMSNNSIKVATVLSLLLVAAGSFLYWLVRDNDPEDYRTSISGAQRIQQLAADWSIETARVRSDPLADFDSLVAFIPQMSQLKGALLAKVRSLPDIPDRLANDVSAYVSAVDAKEERIERSRRDMPSSGTRRATCHWRRRISCGRRTSTPSCWAKCPP